MLSGWRSASVPRTRSVLDLMFKSEALLYLGRPVEACAAERAGAWPWRAAPKCLEASRTISMLACRLLYAGRTDEAVAVARAGQWEGLRAWSDGGGGVLRRGPGHCRSSGRGVWTKRRTQLAESETWGSRVKSLSPAVRGSDLALARGDTSRPPGMPSRRRERDIVRSGPPPEPIEAVSLFRIAMLSDDMSACVKTRRLLPSMVERVGLCACIAARRGADRVPGAHWCRPTADPDLADLHDRAARQLQRARRV